MQNFSCGPQDEDFVKSVYQEIFEENEYAQYGVEVQPGDVVVDLGAHVGVFTRYAIEKGASKVYSYECDPQNFVYLAKNIPISNADLHCAYIGKDHTNLRDIIRTNNLSKIDFLKMDIEGYEWDLLESCDDMVFDVVDKWAIEFHTKHNSSDVSWEEKFNTMYRLLQIIERFNKNGYAVYYEHRHKQWDIVMLYVQKRLA